MRSVSVTVALMFGLLLVGCAAQGVRVPPGYEDLMPCEVRNLELGELSQIGEPGCDLEGSTIVAPDGILLVIGHVGETRSSQNILRDGSRSPEYTVVNWGLSGVGVSVKRPGAPEIWATSNTALDLQQQLARL